jgi:hypothetical protein
MAGIDTAGRPICRERRFAAAPARFSTLPRILLEFEEQVVQHAACFRIERAQPRLRAM